MQTRFGPNQPKSLIAFHKKSPPQDLIKRTLPRALSPSLSRFTASDYCFSQSWRDHISSRKMDGVRARTPPTPPSHCRAETTPGHSATPLSAETIKFRWEHKSQIIHYSNHCKLWFEVILEKICLALFLGFWGQLGRRVKKWNFFDLRNLKNGGAEFFQNYIKSKH